MAQFQFVMRSGPTPGVTFPLDGDQLTIGRDSTNGVAINDAEISRKHARMMFQGGKYVLEDLGSTNGTFVNGQRLAGPVVLKPGDVVSLGEQIVLMYDAIAGDAGATVAVSRKAVQASPPPAYSAPQQQSYAPPPQQHYSAPPPAAKKGNMTPVIIGVGALLFICACAGFFWWVDATYRWCTFFPFISGC
ncbi:MAG: FHA domain-containing protein [Anaerolineales bacterium]|jgi:predicted component of type VI protein secretion system|nr:FHA domain-containing protein [Chloroflexota bacterium]MBK6644999.1 FHA domain-containing protein [Anaerolineales bacterium]MCC6987290.1 FHA domain-containing protein [Anaerolineales bacterium]